jgi:uracil-DNA glycosylase
VLKARQQIKRFAAYPFGHGASYELGDGLPRLFVSFHPSQQNTFTGKLTESMMVDVLLAIREFLSGT